MNAHEAAIAWTMSESNNRGTQGQVEVRNINSGDGNWIERYDHVTGAVYAARREQHGLNSLVTVLLDFQLLVLRYRMDPKVVHDAFLVIDEYADAMAAEMFSGEGDLR